MTADENLFDLGGRKGRIKHVDLSYLFTCGEREREKRTRRATHVNKITTQIL